MTSHYEALGFTLVHFCWQAMALAGLYKLIDFAAPRMRNQTRYSLGLFLMLSMLVCAFATFIYEENRLTAASEIVVAAPFLSTPADKLTLQALLPWLDAAWVAGVMALSLRMAGGLWFINRLSRSAQAVPESVANRFAHAARRLGLAGKVRIRLHPAITGPFVIGAFRSVVYLPVSALTSLSPEQLDAVLAHELEHIRRADYVWNLVQSLIETLFFFHPAVWWLGAKLREQRELCCDDAALRTCQDPLTYATALLSLEEQRRDGPRLAQQNLKMALNGEGSGKSLVSRIARMLGEKASAPRAKGRPTAALALPVVLIALAAFVTPVARVAASVQQDMGLAAPADDKKNCPINTPAFKAKLAAITADHPGISHTDAVKIAEADYNFDGDNNEVDSDDNAGNDNNADSDDADVRDIDPDAIAAEARADAERGRAEIARAKAQNIDVEAITEQARQSAIRAKADMERQGWISDIDPDAIAANARAAAEKARREVADLNEQDIDPDAIAAAARAGAMRAKASFAWTGDSDGWKHFGTDWKAPKPPKVKAPKPPKAPRAPREPVGIEAPAPMMDAVPPAPPAPDASLAVPPAPPAPPAPVPATGARFIKDVTVRIPSVALVTPHTVSSPHVILIANRKVDAAVNVRTEAQTRFTLVTTP